MGKVLVVKLQLAFATLLLFSSATALADNSVNPACRIDKRVVGACFKVHGRFSNWNGNPTQRIWIIGTRRILGVREDTTLPPALEKRLGDFDDVATGDFEVCPLTSEQSGRMQIVCISAVAKFEMSKRKSSH
jgi:hypothetical protein